MKRLLLFAPLVLFGVTGIYFLYVFLKTSGDGAFQASLLPELIGFCLEGFFLVGLFSLIQRRLERDRKHELRESLRGALREILSNLDIALLEENAEPANAQSLDLDPDFVKALFAKLHKNELDLNSMRQPRARAQLDPRPQVLRPLRAAPHRRLARRQPACVGPPTTLTRIRHDPPRRVGARCRIDHGDRPWTGFVSHGLVEPQRHRDTEN